MDNKQKIELLDKIIRIISDYSTSEETPIMVGTLIKPQGIKGFKSAEVGHPVFEFKDRYLIYLESNDGKVTATIPYYKDSLKDAILKNG